MSKRSRTTVGSGKNPSVTPLPPSEAPAVSAPNGKSAWRLEVAISLGLILAIGLVFGRTLNCEFVNYDDDVYVINNPRVNCGLTAAGLAASFSYTDSDNWVPLTTLSHMLDCQMYGLNPGGHHLTNLLLHMAATVLLFLVWRRMTGALWPSACLAALFAIHPLRAESVAWVTERKDVLAGLFFMLTLGAYAAYARRPWNGWRYLAVVLCFALGLMAKPILVTLPLVLLLLDYWPLNRFTPPGQTGTNSPRKFTIAWRLIVEKLPLLVLSLIAGVLTLLAEKPDMHNVELALPLRISNALVSYIQYIWQMICPLNLAVYYPFPRNGLSFAQIGIAVILLTATSAAVFVLRRRHPGLLVGWLWYLVMLIPVIGLVQVGTQSRADRYTYLPQIGLIVMLVWGVTEWTAGWRWRRGWLGGVTAVVLAALMLGSYRQVSYWKNTRLLWEHTLAVAPDNEIVQNALGLVSRSEGKLDPAIAHYQRALEFKSNFPEAHNNLGNALYTAGRQDEAIAHYQRALDLAPQLDSPHNNLGFALLQQGQLDAALAQFQQALAINPGYTDAHNNLAYVLFQKGRADEAIAQLQMILTINPNDAATHNNLANALRAQGRLDEAVEHYQRALAVNSGSDRVHLNLGDTLLELKRTNEAIQQFNSVLALNAESAEAHCHLGRALASLGKRDEAITQFREALRLKPNYPEANRELNALRN